MSTGKQLETYVDRWNRALLRQGIAHIFKVPTPTQIEKRLGGGKVQGRLEKAVWADYAGILWDGRATAGEAKEFKHATQNLPTARLPEHQRDALGFVAEYGGVAWIIVRRVVKPKVIDFIVPVTSREQLDSPTVLEPKFKRPSGLWIHDAAQDWQAYIRDGWKAVKPWSDTH